MQDNEQQPTVRKQAQSEERDPRSTVSFWYEWKEDAYNGEKAKAHRQRADAAYRDYELDTVEVNGNIKEKHAGFGIYYSYAKHLEAAYYSQSPESESIRRFGIDDPLANTMALITERLGESFIDADGFDQTVEKAVGDFIHADKACLQVISEEDEPDVIEIPAMVVQGVNGLPVVIDQTNQPVPPEQAVQLEDGRVIRRIVENNPKIYLLPIGYDKIIHSPNADVELQVKEKAYCVNLTEDEVKARFFGEERNTSLELDELPWTKSKNDEDDPEEEPTKRLKLWEIECDESKKRYWITDKKTSDFLDVRDNTDELRCRFSVTPFIISNTPKEGLYPTPVHTHVKPYIDALDKLWERIVELIPKVERQAILDEKLEDAIQALKDKQDWVTVKDLASMIEGTGDLRNMIQFLPMKELVESIREASNLIDFVEQIFNEHAGIPDILRGQADPRNAAETNQTMAQAATDRFKKDKRAVQKMIQQALELEVDLALKLWSDRKIWKVTGFDFTEPAHQQNFYEALNRLRNDDERHIRVAIKTDSTSFRDEQAEFQKAQALNQLVTQGLATIGGAKNIEFIPVLVELLLRQIDALGGSAEHESDVVEAVNQIVQKKMQQGSQEQDPVAAAKAQEAQAKVQVAQINAEATMAKVQSQAATDGIKARVATLEAQVELAELAQKERELREKARALGIDVQLKDMQLMETAAKTAGTIQKEELDTEQAQIDLAGKTVTALGSGGETGA